MGLIFNWDINAPKPITNPLVPIGESIVLKVTGGTGPYTWNVDQPDSFLKSVNINDSSIVTITLDIRADGTSMITPGVPATITVKDGAGVTGTTMIIPAPAGVMSQHNLLIYNGQGRVTPRIDLMVQETGLATPLHAVPGIINLSNSDPLYQVTPEAGATFVSCYVLNLDKLTDWVPA